MELGAFSVSLNVSDIGNSKDYYMKLGFAVIAGDESQNWLILRNGTTTLGLFQGMLESNTLTFNPGWDQQNQLLEDYPDIRKLYENFQSQGLEIENASIEHDQGPGYFSVKDPDGNVILIDQHV